MAVRFLCVVNRVFVDIRSNWQCLSLNPMTAMQLVPDSHLLRLPIAGVGQVVLQQLDTSGLIG